MASRTLFRLALTAALVVATWLFLTPGGPPMPGHADKLAHGAVFLVLSLLADRAFPDRPFAWAKALPLLAYGAGIELIQGSVPHRFASAADWLADGAGILAYLLLAAFAGRLLPLRVAPGDAGAR